MILAAGCSPQFCVGEAAQCEVTTKVSNSEDCFGNQEQSSEDVERYCYMILINCIF